MDNAPPSGPAVAAPGTRAALRRTGLLVAGLLVLTAAVLGLALALWLDQRRADDLAAHGLRAPGTVTGVAVTYSSGRARQPHGTLTVRFATAGGRAQTAEVEVGTDITTYAEGDAVTVVYDAGDPDRAQVVGADDPQRNDAWLAPAGVGGLLLVLAGLAAARLRRTWRIVRSRSWRAVPARLQALPPTFGSRGRSLSLLELYGAGPDADPRIVVDTRGLRPFGPDLEPTAWIAGDPPSLVVAPPGGRPLHLARRLRPHPRPRRRRPGRSRP